MNTCFAFCGCPRAAFTDGLLAICRARRLFFALARAFEAILARTAITAGSGRDLAIWVKLHRANRELY